MKSPSLEDQFAAGAALEYLLHLLQGWSKTPWITEHTTKITMICRGALAFFATLGLSWQYSGGTLTITGLTVSVIAAGLWHFFRQFAVQHGFGRLIRNGNLSAFQTIVSNVVKQELAAYAQSQAQMAAPRV